MLGGEKAIDGRLRLKLSHNARQRGPVVMNLCFLHATLPVCVVEEIEYSVERLSRGVQHVGERPSLAILKEILASDS